MKALSNSLYCSSSFGKGVAGWSGRGRYSVLVQVLLVGINITCGLYEMDGFIPKPSSGSYLLPVTNCSTSSGFIFSPIIPTLWPAKEIVAKNCQFNQLQSFKFIFYFMTQSGTCLDVIVYSLSIQTLSRRVFDRVFDRVCRKHNQIHHELSRKWCRVYMTYIHLYFPMSINHPLAHQYT